MHEPEKEVGTRLRVVESSSQPDSKNTKKGDNVISILSLNITY